MPSKARKWVLAALDDIATRMPFPILGVDSDGSEFINVYLLIWCKKRQITFTRSRPANKNDGCHVEQKNWALVRTVVGYHRYDTTSELLLLNKIWNLQAKLANYFYPRKNWYPKPATAPKCPKNMTRRPPRPAARWATKASSITARRSSPTPTPQSTPPPCSARSRPSPPSCSP